MGINKNVPDFVPHIYELAELSTSGEDGRNRVIQEPEAVCVDEMAQSRQSDAMSQSLVPLDELDSDVCTRSLRSAEVDVQDTAFPHVNWRPIFGPLNPDEQRVVLGKINDPGVTFKELAEDLDFAGRQGPREAEVRAHRKMAGPLATALAEVGLYGFGLASRNTLYERWRTGVDASEYWREKFWGSTERVLREYPVIQLLPKSLRSMEATYRQRLADTDSIERPAEK